jgi:beta-lactamase regulating signal transducer with metallopeptidase domain
VDDLLGVGLGNALTATALAGLVGFAALRLRPALAHRGWLLVLLKLVTPPLVLVPVWVVSAPPEPPPLMVARTEVVYQPDAPAREEPLALTPQPVPEIPSPPEPTLPERRGPGWRPVLGGVWLAGSLAWWSLAAWRLRRFGRLLRVAVAAPPEVRARARALADRLGLRRCPGVWFVPVRVPPLVWAVVGRPRVLVPADLWGRLGEGQRDALLLHELAHLRRGDQWVRRLELVVLGLYWWLPVAWWARRALEAAEEKCCDAWVVWARPAAAADYALALVRTVEFLAGAPAVRPAAASGAGPVRDLKRRLTMILKETPPRAPARAGWWALLVLGALVLPWLPTWAQSRPERPAEPPPAAPEAPATLSTVRFTSGSTATFTDPPPAAPDAGRAEQVAEARDRVELAAADVTVKKAELSAAHVLSESAQNHLARFEALVRQGTGSVTELDQARAAAASARAQVIVKEAELQQAEVRLRQA